MQNKLRSSLQNFILPGSFLRLFAFVGTSTQYYIQNLQINCVQVGGWHCSTACKLNLSRCRRCFLLTKAGSPRLSSSIYLRAPPCTSRQRLGISNTSDNICFEKPISIAVASRIFFFSPEETIPVRCLFCTRTTTFSFSQPKLTANKLSFS